MIMKEKISGNFIVDNVIYCCNSLKTINRVTLDDSLHTYKCANVKEWFFRDMAFSTPKNIIREVPMDMPAAY